MGLYANAIMKMVNQIGNPTITKSTTTAEQPKEGLDLSGLMMMLMMNSLFKQPPNAVTNKNPYATNFTAPANANPAGVPASFMAPGAGYDSNGMGQDYTYLMKLLFGG